MKSVEMEPSPKLLLWDIDGTVVLTGKAGEYAMDHALAQFGVEGSIHDVDYPGRTDRMICRMLLEHHGIPATEERVHDFVEAYLNGLAAELPKRKGEVLPGILDILERCHHRTDCINALLTGNMERGAKLKLGHYRVWDYFEFGAFADDANERNALGPIALERASRRLGVSVDPQQVFIIGDTQHDIACGRAIGARTVAVATGAFSVEDLAQHKPDHLFADLSDTAAFEELLK